MAEPGIHIIDKRTFCKEIGIDSDCWIMNVEHPEDAIYLKVDLLPNDTRYYYDNGDGMIREFVDMKEYHEIWMRELVFADDRAAWSIRTLWQAY